MSTSVFLAVLLAALLHATWNAMVKGSEDKHLAMAAVVLGHAPAALLTLPLAPTPDPASLPWIVAGVALHIGYQQCLIAGYRLGDLTQVYPIARGIAPLLVAAVSVGLLGVSLALAETLAVVLIAGGIVSLALVRRADGVRNPRAVGAALVTGCFIAAYSLVDGTGARVAATALGFWSCSALGNVVAFTAWTALARPGLLRRLCRDRRAAASGLMGGTASYLAYALVVWAFLHAPIALVTALREVSIVFALVIGTLILGERLDIAKVASTFVTITGAVLLRFARS